MPQAHEEDQETKPQNEAEKTSTWFSEIRKLQQQKCRGAAVQGHDGLPGEFGKVGNARASYFMKYEFIQFDKNMDSEVS